MLDKVVLDEKYAGMAYEIFCDKNWETEYLEGEISAFDRFCERLAILENDEQRELVLELTKDYMKIAMTEYEKLLIKAWRGYLDNNPFRLEDDEMLPICPILIEEDFGKEKSGSMVLYMCGSLELRRFSLFSDEQIRLCSSPALLVDLFIKKRCNAKRIVLIDDYIGSGESAIGCISYLEKHEIDRNKIDIIALVAQEEAVRILKDEGIMVYSALTRKKGISDKYKEDEIENKISIMKRIESNLKVDSKYSLGYNKTEALISLIKTPNNTFPVFWYENKKSRAPFPRKKNIKVI